MRPRRSAFLQAPQETSKRLAMPTSSLSRQLPGPTIVFLTTLDTLSDSTLRLYDTDGSSSLLFDNNGGVGLASLIEWNAPADGIYFPRSTRY